MSDLAKLTKVTIQSQRYENQAIARFPKLKFTIIREKGAVG